MKGAVTSGGPAAGVVAGMSRSRSRAGLVLLAASLLGSCSEFFAPLHPDAIRVTPPPVYALWWEQVRECSGVDRKMSSVDFYVVPNRAVLNVNGKYVAGYYDASQHRLVLAGAVEFYGQIVRHEMLHAFVPMAVHPREYFRHRCGDVVSCAEDCRAEAGEPSLPASAARIPESELELSVRAEPLAPSASTYNGRFTLVVSARNPHPYPIVVTLPPSGDAGRPVSFRYRVSSGATTHWYDSRIYDAGATYFRAHETKRAVYDYAIGPVVDDAQYLQPGSYTLDGGFGSRWAPTASFVIAP